MNKKMYVVFTTAILYTAILTGSVVFVFANTENNDLYGFASTSDMIAAF